MTARSMRPARLLLIALLAALAALAVRSAWLLAVPTRPISDFAEYDRLAQGVVTGDGYSLPDGRPTTYRPPGYPLYLAVVYAAAGHSWLAARLSHLFLAALTVLLTFLIGRRLFGRATGLLAAFIVALFPSYIMFGNLLAAENLFIPLLLGLLLALVSATKEKELFPGYLLLAGFLLGLTILIRPAVILFPLFFGAALFLSGLPLRRTVAAVLLVGLAAAATVAPWTIRNYLVTGEFIPVASEGGITFLAGHNQQALQGQWSLAIPEVEQLQALDLTEAELDAHAYRLAFQFIRENPRAELLLLANKFRYFFQDDVSGVSWNASSALAPLPLWLVTGLKALAQLYYMAVALLALSSFFLLRRPAGRGSLILLSLAIYWTAIHLAFYGKDRFRLPLMPVLAIFAAVTVALIGRRWLRRRQGSAAASR